MVNIAANFSSKSEFKCECGDKEDKKHIYECRIYNNENPEDLKNEEDLKNKDDLKNENDLKNEDGPKNENNLKNEDDLKSNLFAPPT